MSFEQTYYTSCTVGLRGSKGFQTNAASSGVDPATLMLIERLGVYVPPVSAPSRPTAVELEQFPLALIYQRLPDGRAVIAQARYVGADYSGRFGNYFTHSLITARPEADLGDLLPIELWRSPDWVAAESASTTLPALEHLRTGGAIDPESVMAFLRQPGRLQHFANLLTAVEQALATKRRLILVDHSEAIARWIGAISYSLPHPLALRLTFTTYTKNPYQADGLVVGTTADSDFAFSAHEIEHQYSVFDFVKGRRTRIATVSPFAARVAEAWSSGHGEQIASFGRFVAQVAPDLPSDELTVAFDCYGLVARFAAAGTDLGAILRWCGAHLGSMRGGDLRAVLAALGGDGAVRPEILEAAADLYRAACRPDVDTRRRQIVEADYLTWLVTRAARSAPPALLLRLVASPVLSPSAAAAAQPLKGAWLELAHEAREPERVAALVRLGDGLGFLSSDAVAQQLGGAVLAPCLSDAAVQGLVRSLATRPSGGAVTRGIIEAVRARSGDVTVVCDTFADPRSAALAGAVALECGDLGLYFLLLGRLASGPQGRLDALRSGLARVAQAMGHRSPAVVEAAVAGLWRGAAPTLAEASAILRLCPPAELAATNVPARFVDALAAADVRRPDPNVAALAEALAAPGFAEALGQGAGLLQDHLLAARLREGSPGSLHAALQRLSDSHAQPARGLLELAAERLVEVDDTRIHQDLLVQAGGALGSRFWDAYRQAVQAALTPTTAAGRSRPLSEARLAARLLRVWTRCDQTPCAAQANEAMGAVFSAAMANWRRDDLLAIDQALEGHPAAQARWREMSARHEGGRIASWLRKWLVVLVVFVAGAVAVWIVLTRLAAPGAAPAPAAVTEAGLAAGDAAQTPPASDVPDSAAHRPRPPRAARPDSRPAGPRAPTGPAPQNRKLERKPR